MTFPLVLAPSIPRDPGQYEVSTVTAAGLVRSALCTPAGYSLWLVRAVLAAGAGLTWRDDHGDEAVYVLSGTLHAGETEVTSGGAVIIESGATAVLAAVGPTEILHVGPASAEPADAAGPLGPTDPAGHGIHVVTDGSSRDMNDLGPDGSIERTVAYYADSTCPTCRILLLRVTGGPWRSRSHAHSADEIIYVTSGVLEFGALKVAAGSLILVPADTRYGFKTTGPFQFVNYRRDASYVQKDPKGPRVLETVATLTEFLDREGADTLR
jgi:quercetin dioxygenase-like cupin family protein